MAPEAPGRENASKSASMNRPNRPGTVTIVVVLTWLVAILNIVWGIVLLFNVDDLSTLAEYNADAQAARIWAIVLILFGLIVGAVASSLGKGSQFARFLVSLLMIFRIIADVFFLAQYGSVFLGGTVAAILFAFLVLIMLWTAKASRFFNPA
jgi:hypothetical protein